MKVLLIAVNAKFIHSNLAVRYLKSYTRDIDYDCSIMEFSINDRREKVLEAIAMEKPDAVAFSCYIWNIGYVAYLSRHLKLIRPECTIIYGGPEVSYDPEKFLAENDGEFVIAGEGEETFRELICAMLEHSPGQDGRFERAGRLGIKGLHAKTPAGIISGGSREPMDMGRIAFPYDDFSDFENKIVYYEASRGCPFSCKYCLSSTTHGVRFHSLERVKSDLARLAGRGVSLVKFVDRTFNCSRDFAVGIWEFLIALGGDTRYHFEISADLLGEKEMDILKKAPEGLFQFEVGVQTTNSQVLKNISRHVNFGDIKEKVCELERLRNIKQHLDLIAGLPGENLESFRKSFDDVFSIKPEEIQLGFLKLLKGSQMLEEAGKWGMVHSPEPPYEILRTNDISYEELVLLKRVEEVVDKYYNSGKFGTILGYFLHRFDSPFSFFEELGEFFHRRGMLSRNVSSTDYYKVFLEFFSERFPGDSMPLREIIKYDYLRFNRKRWLPDFLLRETDREAERKIRACRGKNLHVEKYFIDILGYLENGSITEGEYYLTYDEENGIIDGVSAAELQGI